MTLAGKQVLVGSLGFLFLASLVAVSIVDSTKRRETAHPLPVVPAEAKGCVDCHAKVSPQVVAQWAESQHGAKGIACLSCHGVKEGGFLHHDVRITNVVTPKTCGTCHRGEAAEMEKSSHGKGVPGMEVRLVAGRPDPATWPAPLVGRINPDGSAGSCLICHGRHRFELTDARSPEMCASCHLADGAAEAWRRSPHGGIALAQAGQPNPKAPGCPTCHISPSTPGGKATHDTRARVSWTVVPGGKPSQEKDADARRDAMTEVCSQCHGPLFINAAFQHVDALFTEPPLLPKGSALPGYLFQPQAWPHLSPIDHYTLQHLPH
ncbi:MAG: multiheme c-type cytochrome [Myxococcaceae bacterium]